MSDLWQDLYTDGGAPEEGDIATLQRGSTQVFVTLPAPGFDIDALPAADFVVAADYAAVSQSGTERKATLAQLWSQEVGGNGAFTQDTNSKTWGLNHDTIEAENGATAFGYIPSSGGLGYYGMIRAGYGSLAFGSVGYYGGTIDAGFGNSGASGSLAHGNLGYGGGYIEASGYGATAMGFAAGSSSIGISAVGTGGFAAGHAHGGVIEAYGPGSFALGDATSFDISALQHGSFAMGYAQTGAIIANALGAGQFGPGTNEENHSLQIGSLIRLKGTTGVPASNLHNGDVWVANNYVYIRSNGVSVKIV